jgi:hypothetical protein
LKNKKEYNVLAQFDKNKHGLMGNIEKVVQHSENSGYYQALLDVMNKSNDLSPILRKKLMSIITKLKRERENNRL